MFLGGICFRKLLIMVHSASYIQKKITYILHTVTPRTTLSVGRKITQKPCSSSYVLQIRVVEVAIRVAQEILQKTVKSV